METKTQMFIKEEQTDTGYYIHMAENYYKAVSMDETNTYKSMDEC